jgi:serine O-acetyltransferase
MKMSIPRESLAHFVTGLADNHLQDGKSVESPVASVLPRALDRLEYCFSHVKLKYYISGNQVTFNHLNSDHLATLIYFISNELRANDYQLIAEKFGYINKILNGLDVYPHVQMPDIFLLVHPVGAVIGNADYQDFLVVYQQVTIGALSDVYPRLGRGTVLWSGATVLGGVVSGNNVVYGANALVAEGEIPDNSLVVSGFPHRVIPRKHNVSVDFFGNNPLSAN